MTEQQEQSEETGLLPSQDLDPSKEDDAHGHFRQISHTRTKKHAHTSLRCSPPLRFHPHTICILCTVMGSSPGRFIFTALIFVLLFRPCLISNNSGMHANKETPNGDLQRTWLFTPPTPFPKDQQKRIRHQKKAAHPGKKSVESVSTRFAVMVSTERRPF